MITPARMKISALLLLATIFSLSTSFARESRTGAGTALQALPPQFAREVVRLSADNGRPDPMRWYVLARNRREGGLFVKNPLYSITITDGQISEAKRFVDARQISIEGTSSIFQASASTRVSPSRSPETLSVRRDRECAAQVINSLKEDPRQIPSGKCGPTEIPIDILALSRFPPGLVLSYRRRTRDFRGFDHTGPNPPRRAGPRGFIPEYPITHGS